MRPQHLAARQHALLLTALLLAACGLQIPAPAPPTQPPEPRVLRVYTLRDPAIERVLDVMEAGFARAHPDVRVEPVYASGQYGAELLNPQSAARVDVVWLADVFTTQLVEGDALLDLEDLAKSDAAVRLDDVVPAALELGRVRGRPGLYMLPTALETVQMYYNRTLWEAAGAPLPEAGWTWDDLAAACEKVQDASPDVRCLSFSNAGLAEASWWAYWLPFVRGYGGDALSADGRQSTLSSPESLAGLEAYVGMSTDRQIAEVPLRDDNCFLAQRCAAFFTFAGAVPFYRDEIGERFAWDVQLTPAFPGGRFVGMGAYGYAVARGASDRQLAWDFVKYGVTPEGQRALADAYLAAPLLVSMGDQALDLPPPPASIDVFVAGRQYGILPPAYPTRCGSVYDGLVGEAVNRALRQALTAQMTVEEAFSRADRQIQTCLDAAS